MRSGSSAPLPLFLCETHHRDGDVPIPADAVFRRHTILIEVHLAGASANDGVSRTEAVTRIESLLAPLGGLVTVVSITSQVGRLARPASLAPRRPGREGS